MKLVGIISKPGRSADLRLLDLLASAFSVRFEARTPDNLGGVNALVSLGAQLPAESNIPCLVMTGSEGAAFPNDAAPVQFSSSPLAPAVFRGRTLDQIELGPFRSLQPGADGVLATIAGKPVWTACQSNHARVDHVALSLPEFDESRSLFHYFEGFNFFRLLPLVDFLRRLNGDDLWRGPGLRACFIFDDPNLRGSRYGWLDYADVVRDAARVNYHVALATVPLDAWCASKKSAAFFAKSPERLSLLVHGNDHLHGELAGFSSEQEALARLAQALQRIERLESSFGIKIPRVMAAPHGACSEHGLRAMARLGYEATTLGYGAFCASNPGKPWSQRIGLRICDVVSGLPSIPRFRFKYGQSFILLAAYLDQAIIPYGHHQDVAHGLGVLEDLATFINSLGPVQWTDMQGIARSNYLTRQEGSIFRVKSFARTLETLIPQDATELVVHRAWESSEDEGLRLTINGGGERSFAAYASEPIPVRAGDRVGLVSVHPASAKPAAVAKTNADSFAFARRQFCEIRDRFAPLTPAFLRP